MARQAAQTALTLDDLRAALTRFDLCELKRGARSTVFADGNPAARVLILGEAPGREEDQEGLPFVGRAGQLLDRMFETIGLSRQSPDPESALYITNVMPWRPPQNREPEPDEIAMLRPFLERHIALINPDVIVSLGNTPCIALLNQKGILRLRGTWTSALGKPVLPMTHPAYLLRNPAAKREAWADLLSLKARLT
jgi:DNA polymerase